MNNKEIADITKIVSDYNERKIELLEKKREIEGRYDRHEISFWQRDYQIENLFFIFSQTIERNRFVDLVIKAENDSNFEKYFRAINFKVFYNIEIDPEKP